MKFVLYLDDVRIPPYDTFKAGEYLVVLARNYDDAVDLYQHYFDQHTPFDLVSFDHDLGNTSNSGYDFAHYLVKQDMDHYGFIPCYFQFNVHSANPVGAKNIESLLNNYLKFRRELHGDIKEDAKNEIYEKNS